MKTLLIKNREYSVKFSNCSRTEVCRSHSYTNEYKYPVSALPAVLILFLFIFSAYPEQFSTIVRDWSLSGERTEIFEMTDTCMFTVNFIGEIAPTVHGYERFSVTVSDSIDPAGLTAIPVLRFSFDAGFLDFKHIITVTIPFSSPLIPDSLRHPGSYRLYRDPFPYTWIHQWYAYDSLTIDSTQSLIRFVYHHPDYIQLQKSKNHASVKICSEGYPFDFGLFCHPSLVVDRLRNSSSPDAGFICYPNKNGIIVYRNGSKDKSQNTPCRVVFFNGQGRKIGQWSLSVFPALLPLSYHASHGIYLAAFYQENRLVSTFSGIFQGNNVTK